MLGCEIGRDAASQSHSLSQRGPTAVEGVKHRYYSIQPAEGATKLPRPKLPFHTRVSASQGKAPWVDSVRADCFSFLVPGAAGACLPASSRSLRLCPELAFAEPQDICFELLPTTPPHHPCKKRNAQHKLLQHKGAHTHIYTQTELDPSSPKCQK